MIKRRLAVLRAAPTLDHLANTPGRPHALSVDRAGQFAVDLRGPSRLIFEPAESPPPQLPTGGLDRGRVTRIRILEVADYHD